MYINCLFPVLTSQETGQLRFELKLLSDYTNTSLILHIYVLRVYVIISTSILVNIVPDFQNK